MYRRLIHNWSLKLTALVLAVALWSHVRGQVNPWEVASFKVRLSASAPAGFVLQNADALPNYVTVMLRGPRLTLRQFKGSTPANPLTGGEDAPLLTTSRVRAFLDFNAPRRGEQKVAIKIETALEDVEFVGARPSEVAATLDVASQKEVPVETQFDLPTAWRVTNSSADVNSAQVSGALQALERVVAVHAQIESKVSAPGPIVFERVGLVAVDSDGDIVKGVSVEPEFVKVSATVTERLDEKRVPIKVRLTGDPARGYELGTIEVEPSTITLRGTRRALSNIESLHVEVKIDRPSTEVSQRVRLIAPEGVEIISTRRVRVRVGISPLPQANTATDNVGSTPAAGRQDGGTITTPAAPRASELPQPAPASR